MQQCWHSPKLFLSQRAVKICEERLIGPIAAAEDAADSLPLVHQHLHNLGLQITTSEVDGECAAWM